tara:strand:- start:12 stop:1517 length:1506 start_codon:yes stop_codon:yes gene_type:complete
MTTSTPTSNWIDFAKQGARIQELVNVTKSITRDSAKEGNYSVWKNYLDHKAMGISSKVYVEIDSTNGEWCNLTIGNIAFNLAEIEYELRDSITLFDPRYGTNENSWSALRSSSEKNVAMMLAKQMHMELLHEGISAKIVDKNPTSQTYKQDVKIQDWRWADTYREPTQYWSDPKDGTKASKKKHFVVPVLQPDELEAARDLSEFRIIYTEFAEKLKEVCKAHINEPIYFQGAAGTGKSLMAQVLGAETDKQVINRVTFTAKMDVAMTLGNKFPTSMWRAPDGEVIAKSAIGENMAGYEFLGIGLDWRDGVVTKMARQSGTGGMLVLDELPKAPPEFVNRLHEILEDEFPTMTIYENAEDQVSVNKDLWVVATGNPVGGGYFNNPLDKALLDRMRVFNIDKPVADEEQILNGLLPEKFFGDTTKHLLRAAKTLRDSEETAISTRALIMVAKSILRGVGVVPAFQVNFFNTMPKDRAERAESAVQTQFFEDWNKYGPASKLQY